jgi:hypothetical protein
MNFYFFLSYFQIDCVVKLSGMPDLTMSFMNPRMFDDTSFHPCVRFKRWEVSLKAVCRALYITYRVIFGGLKIPKLLCNFRPSASSPSSLPTATSGSCPT